MELHESRCAITFAVFDEKPLKPAWLLGFRHLLFGLKAL